MRTMTTAVGFIFIVSTGSALAQDTPFTLSVERQNSIFLEAFGKPPVQRQDGDRLNAQITGTERSECRDYGRSSTARADADTEVISQRADSISLRLTASSLATGGHYRTCAQCILGNCVGLMGNDTRAQARATASVNVKIGFSAEYPAADYLLDVSVFARGASPTMRLTDASGKSVATVKGLSGPTLLRGGGGATYYVSIELPVTTFNEGGCCEDEKLNSARLDLGLRKAPILDSQRRFDPYIRGGNETAAYPYVGALLLDGRLHCTGTLVAKRTILTAAHCLSGYETQIDKMSFVFGPNIIQPSHPPSEIVGIDYPNEAGAAYRFNPKTLEDDIGVLYLKEDVQVIQPVRVHDSVPPSWPVVLEKKSNLIFVGFGYDVIQNEQIAAGNEQIAAGIKREAAWTINLVENRRVGFEVPGKNTCKGDSGGPAFLIVDGALMQVAITSGGSPDCTTGFETRVDAYIPWLKGRLK